MNDAALNRAPRAPRQTVQPALPEAVDAARAQLAAAAGIVLQHDAYGCQAVSATPPEAWRDGFVAPLPDLSVLTVLGPDAASFLHAQLTNDVIHLEPGTARLAGYCTPKGRLLANWLLWRDAEAVQLVGAQPLAATLAARLGLYVLRAKATVRDDAARTVLIGAAGAPGAAALRALGIEPPGPMAVRMLAGAQAGTVAGLAAVPTGHGELPRWLLAVALDALPEIWAALAAQAPVAGSAAWRWLEVLSGVARVAGGVGERFVPQMVNLELAGGVDFRKGCYPGQEIVARSQYLGRLKRRMFRGWVDAPEPAPGEDVIADGASEPVGQVVLAAPDPAGGVALLFEAQIERVQSAALRLSPEGAALESRELPYTVPF